MIKLIIETLDGSVITPRTGKNRCVGICSQLPAHKAYLLIHYLNEDCESPGVALNTNQVEQMGNEYNFVDAENRPFKITVLDEDYKP